MAAVKPFAALRPKPELAAQICELPYDVMSSEEARACAAGNPLSFLRVSKPEIDLPRGTDPYAPEVYAKGRENLDRLLAEGALVRAAAPGFYLYRQVMGGHSQTGFVAVASCEEYQRHLIKKHELTRVDKEDDRVRHLEALNAQTGPVFLAYRAVPALDEFIRSRTAGEPDTDFTAPDGVRHTAWTITEPADVQFVEAEFGRIPCLYIADGHHRSAAAARVCQARQGQGASAWFLAVIFPHRALRILPYHRVLKDLNGRSPDGLLAELRGRFTVEPAATPQPTRKHQVGLFLAGHWHALTLRPELTNSCEASARLDVALLQTQVLEPIFGIKDPRTSERISFVGGIRGTDELEKLVNRGEYACALAMFPTAMEDLMAIADAGGIMPPKSTWFEPKLRDAMFSHQL